MDYILQHESPHEHYTSDACIVWCFDARFSKLYETFLATHQLANVDLIKVAGGAKDLASPQDVSSQAYILDQITKSIALHHTPKVVLMMHAECGAYGGESRADFYTQELAKAQAVVASAFPNLQVESYLADFKGIIHVA